MRSIIKIMSNGSVYFQKYSNTNQRYEEEGYEMKLCAFFMILVFLFVGMLGFGSINEFEMVGTVDALNIQAVSVDEIHLLDSVAPQETTGLVLLDVQAMIAVVGFNNYWRIMLSSIYSDDMDTLSIQATKNGFILGIPGQFPGRWGDRNRYILSDPYGGKVLSPILNRL